MAHPQPTAPARPTSRWMTPWDAITQPSVANLLYAVAAGVLAAAVAAILVLGQSATYATSATLQLDQPKLVAATTEVGPLLKLNALRLKYVALVPTSEIALPTAQAIGVPVATVRRVGSAFASPESLLIVTTGRSGSRSVARRVAEGLARELVAYVDHEQTANAIPPQQRIVLRIVDHAPNAGKVSPTKRRASTVGAFTGGVALVAAYVVLQLLTAGRRSS